LRVPRGRNVHQSRANAQAVLRLRPKVARFMNPGPFLVAPFDGGLMTRALGFCAAAVVSVAAIPVLMDVSAAQAGTVVLAPHRAVYDLKLLRTPGKRQIESVRGRILYDFSGSPCEGYILQFRQVSELDSGEGKIALSDLRANTWEEADAKSFRFNSTNYLNE